MGHLSYACLKSASIAFVVLLALAFTPLDWLPGFLSLPLLLGWEWIVLVLLGAGAPFAGFLFAVIFARKGERLKEVANLSGIWVGAVSGSWVGLALTGELQWT